MNISYILEHLDNHFSCLRKYKPRNKVAENIVTNRVNRANHHVKLRFPDSSYRPIAPKKIPYMIKIHAPIKNIFFPGLFIFSSKLNIYYLVLNLGAVINNLKKYRGRDLNPLDFFPYWSIYF